jgi:hypothetical protein
MEVVLKSQGPFTQDQTDYLLCLSERMLVQLFPEEFMAYPE